MADFGRFGSRPPAAQTAGTPRGAGISGKKKGPETIRALVVGSIEQSPETLVPQGFQILDLQSYRQSYRHQNVAWNAKPVSRAGGRPGADVTGPDGHRVMVSYVTIWT